MREKKVNEAAGDTAQEPEDSAQVSESGVEETGPEPRVELTITDAREGGKPSEVAPSVRAARFAPLSQEPAIMEQNSLDLLLDVELELSVELGRTAISVREVLQLGPGAIVELEKLAGEPVDILVNGRRIAKGEVVVVDENFGVRITKIDSREEGLAQAL